MKINDIIPGQQGPAKAGNKQDKPTSTQFHDLLQHELNSLSKTEQTHGATQVSATGQIPASLRLDSLTVTEATINTLDSFSNALADSRLSAQDLEPFVSALEDETTALLDLKKQLPDSDPLAAVLERVATVSSLETHKYRRGDYNA